MARFTHPSAAESLREEHACLMELFPRVREVLAARTAKPQKVVDLLEHLAQHVLDHFEHEERGGYFTEAVQAAPQLHKQIKALLNEHTEMALQLIALHQHAASGPAKSDWWRKLEEGFEAFHERFTAHEEAENWVALVAYGDDIGTGD
jgi:iron-sulfur cluster repair protein YtfE (RIC family)